MYFFQSLYFGCVCENLVSVSALSLYEVFALREYFEKWNSIKVFARLFF